MHAFAFQFMPRALAEMVEGLSGRGSMMSDRSFFFSQWKNFYLANRALSDENRYIMERKYQGGKIGNFLELPSVLLKR